MKNFKIIFIAVLILSFLTISCSKSDAPDQVNISEYKSATEDQEFEVKNIGKLKRVVTTDSFDKVLAFYKKELKKYNPQSMSQTSNQGRQAALTVMADKQRPTTVTIQEMKKEGKVYITYMKIQY